MALPLPKVVADIGPGGGIVTARRGINALTESEIENQIKKIEAQFAPITKQAEAASKLAYANLTGPQFLAKLMGNDAIIANMNESQRNSALQNVYQAGSGGGTGNALFNPSSVNPSQIGNGMLGNGFLSKLVGGMGSLFNGDGNRNLPQQNPVMQPPSINRNIQNQTMPSTQGSPSQSYPEYGASNRATDEEINAVGREDPYKSGQSKFAENVGTYKGIVQEGTESGKIRAKDIDELNNTVFKGQTNQSTLDAISNILSSPEFEQIRKVPLAGHYELSYYSKFGTPEQQNMVGQYYALTGNIIKDSSRDFAGQFRKGEQQLLEGMKPGPADTVDTARGKLESLSVMNKLLTERSRLTSKLMNKYHINKLDASEIADNQLDGKKIRQQIHDKINPMITIRNKRTGKVETVSVGEARKRGIPNV